MGSQPQLKSPWLGTLLVYRGVSTINLFPSEYYYSVCSWDAGVGETAASGFLSFFCFDNNLKLAEFQVDYTHHDC